MTKKEIKLTQENKELKEQLKAKTHKDKPLFNPKYFTTTKIILHSIQILSIIIVAFVMYMCKFLAKEPIYLASVLGVLTTNIFVVFTMVTKYYIDKSTTDNESKNKKERYEMKMKFVEKMSVLIAEGKITPDAVNLFKTLITENETTIATNGYGGMSYIDSQTYGVTNPTVQNPIENVSQNTDSEGMC